MQAVCGLDVSTVMWREHGLGVWWFPLGSVVCFECCQLSLPFAPESALLLSPVLAVTFFSGPLLTAPPLVGHSLMVKAGASL